MKRHFSILCALLLAPVGASAQVAISQLPGATTPLAGTEIVPIVQSGVTKKVSVANIQTSGTQTANTVLAAPNGSSGAPTFRALVGADLAAAFSQNEIPSGAINGVNTSYTLAHAPVIIWLYYNGILLEPGSGNDFTYSGNAITMLYALPTGAKLRAYYSF